MPVCIYIISTRRNNLNNLKEQQRVPCLLTHRPGLYSLLEPTNMFFPYNRDNIFSKRGKVLSSVMHQTWQKGYLPGGPGGPARPGSPGGPGGPGTGVETLDSPLGP